MTRRQALAWMASMTALPLGCRSVVDNRPTLRLADWGGAGDDSNFFKLVQDVYREFEEATGVRLRVEGTPGSQDYMNKILLDFVAGSMPDIIKLDASSAAAFIDNDALLDLAPMADGDKFQWTDFYPNVVDIAKRGERILAVPTDFTPMVMYCNRKLFRDARVEIPVGKWSYDDFLELAVATTRNGTYGFEFANWMPGWVMFLWNNGADCLSPDGKQASGFLDSPNSVAAVQFLSDLILKHKAAPDLSQAAAAGADLFATGRAAMKVVGHWNRVTMKASKDVDPADVVVIELPTERDSSVTVMYEAGQAIGKKCRHPDLAWRFLKFYSSFDVQRRFNASGLAVSARQDVQISKQANWARIDRKLSPAELAEREMDRAFQQIVPSSRKPWGATVEGYDRVEQIGQKAMDAILKNGVAVQQALSSAANEIDQEFAKR